MPQANPLTAIIRELKRNMNERDTAELIKALAVTGAKQPAKMTKASIVEELLKTVPVHLLGIHTKYIQGISPEAAAALSRFREMGFVTFNHFLRTGRLKVEVPFWRLSQRVQDLSFSMTDLKNASSKDLAVRRIARNVSQVLREAISEEVEGAEDKISLIGTMRKIVEAAPRLQENITLYRGEHNNMDVWGPGENDEENACVKYAMEARGLDVGDEFVRKEFTSFSISSHIATAFNWRSGCCTYRLRLPKGSGGVLFFPPDTIPFEYEAVVAPGTRYRVTGVSVIKSEADPVSTSVKLLDLEIIPTKSRSKKV